MKLSTAIQEALIVLLCYDDTPGGAKLVRGLVPAKVYDPFYRDVAEAADEYIAKYDKPPGDHTLDIFDGLKARRPDSSDVFDRIYESLQFTRQQVNAEYVVEQANAFARYQTIKRGLAKALDALKGDSPNGVDLAEAALLEATKGSLKLFHKGLELFDPRQALAFLDKEERVAFPTGIPQLDASGFGPSRKRLGMFMAPSGSGKSWWLVTLSKYAVLAGKTVVYVTLELDEEDVAQRMVQAMFSVSKRRQTVLKRTLEKDELGRFVSFGTVDIKDRPALEDHNIHSVLTEKIGRFTGRARVLIKQFPTGTLTIRELEAYLDALEGAGVMTDLLVLDYADLMKLDIRDIRSSVGEIYKNLRGIAIKRNIAISTASQTNRGAVAKKVAGHGEVAEDYSKIATCDVVISYNQTPEELALGLARLYVVKGRTDADRYTVLISQAYPIGQFATDSVPMASSYWEEMKDLSESEK